MVRRKGRSRRGGSRRACGFGFVVVILLFLVSALLLTCQKRPGGVSSDIWQSRPSHSPRRSIHSGGRRSHAVRQVTDQKDGVSPGQSASHAAPVIETNTRPSHVPVSAAPDVKAPDSPEAASAIDNEFSRGSISEKRIAITFDAGASAKPAAEILRVLAKHNVTCTFFLTGKWMEKNPSLTKQIAEAGHEIGNHSYSHKRLTDLDATEIAMEVDKADRLAIELTGESTKPLFRAPFGARDKRVLTVLKDQGYKSIYWDLDCWDSVKASITSDQIRERVLDRVRNGSVILMHCGSQATADALDALLTKLDESGYEPVTVSQLAGL